MRYSHSTAIKVVSIHPRSIMTKAEYTIFVHLCPTLTVHSTNATKENFFEIFKCECLNRVKIVELIMLEQLTARYIHFFNYERIKLKMVSPHMLSGVRPHNIAVFSDWWFIFESIKWDTVHTLEDIFCLRERSSSRSLEKKI